MTGMPGGLGQLQLGQDLGGHQHVLSSTAQATEGAGPHPGLGQRGHGGGGDQGIEGALLQEKQGDLEGEEIEDGDREERQEGPRDRARCNSP